MQKNNVKYDHPHNFQMEWATTLNWVGVLTTNKKFHNVKCKVCSVIEGQPKFLLPKWDTFTKHKGRYKAKKNMSQYGVKKGTSTSQNHVRNFH